ncbi:hypothetical protein IW140_003075 [Coemansia sp. RSA 1813]|nr:hypothetical protein EV178_006223 [Coemansia sp. RSA 1646]KAJ1771284.1 hypothetical protein LPJ74_002435 [Coemansia sp. RSA 1843]KAJ2085689.1 hypothetical protein IW138_006173 [Coemansia sp. RSA 986]KAJ2210531.1 hypothetical protein EV179_006173 [Coemansia sp. RSA 487]KAJ2569521.1 hypothetical protein IW140_003075 [Coemansia sp. RSA 1813]
MPKVYSLVSGSNGESHFVGLNDNQTVQDLVECASNQFKAQSGCGNSVLKLLTASAAPFEDQTNTSRCINISAATPMAQCLEMGGGIEPLFFEFHVSLDVCFEYLQESKSVSVPYTATVRDAVQDAFGVDALTRGNDLIFIWKDNVVDLCTVIGPYVQSTSNTINIISRDI